MGVFFAALVVVMVIAFGVLKLSEVGNVRPSPHSVAILVSIVATIFSWRFAVRIQ